jgi:hypothetical protein
MKRKILLALIIFLGCKNSNVDQLSTIKGSYIFFEDAAVLQNTNVIYGVFMNEKAFELNEKAAKYKTSNNDNVNVEVTGIISTKKDDIILWENKIEIIDIIAISSANDTNNTLKSGIK